MEKFRDINHRDEILALMKRAPASNRGEIWQTLDEGRHHYKIVSFRDDPSNKALVIESDQNYAFNARHPIYVRINHRDLIFKLNARSFIISGNKLACVYPTMAKAIEKRGTVRIPLPPGRDTTVVLTPLGAGAAELKVKLVDISMKGLGISVSDSNREYLIRNEKFLITSINDIFLAGNHQVEIKYVERLARGMIKSGFVLKRPFTDITYNLICKSIFKA